MFSRLLTGLLVFAVVATPAALVPASTANADAYVMQINMYGTNETPPVQTNAWGFFRFFFNADRSEADITLDVKGITGGHVTSADIREGAPGTNGPVVKHLSDGGFIVTSSHASFTSQEIQDMAAGKYYISLATTAHPDGELRGQIIVPSDFLPGSQPAPATPASSTPVAGTTPVNSTPGGSVIHPPNTGDAGLAAGR